MAELSSGKPPFYDKDDDIGLAMDICGGLRPEFGKGTPKFYKKLAYRCMSANLNQRPTANELHGMLHFWWSTMKSYENYENVKKDGYDGKKIRVAFNEANKKIQTTSLFANQECKREYKSQ